MGHTKSMRPLHRRPWRELRAYGAVFVAVGVAYLVIQASYGAGLGWTSIGLIPLAVGLLAWGIAVAKWSSERSRVERPSQGE